MGFARLLWSEAGLSLVVSTLRPHPMRVEFDVDLNNDGWFSGNDNLEFRVDTASGSSTDGTTLRQTEMTWVLDIPISVLRAEKLEQGHKLGIRLRVEQNGRPVNAFEPWSLFEMELR